ncbi:MAG: PaaI family thioesterase [Polyangiales bacterium]
MPYSEKLVGNPETGVVHGGCITTLIDSVCGAAVFLSLREMRRVATLDLRIDYLRPAKPKKEIACRAHAYRITKHVAFVRAFAYDDDPNDWVASAAGTFMIFEPRSKEPR